jgi:tetratricopeptide (TPR) repeat protein
MDHDFSNREEWGGEWQGGDHLSVSQKGGPAATRLFGENTNPETHMPRKKPSLPSVVLSCLRRLRGWTAEELSEASGISDGMISYYETRREPDRETLETLAAAMGYGPEDVDSLLFALEAAEPVDPAPMAPVDPTSEERREIRRIATRAGRTVVGLAELHLLKQVRAHRAHRARRHAARLWEKFRTLTPAQRRLLIEKSCEHQTWAFAVRLCHESEEAASDRADRAFELAELALRVAQLAPGEELWRSRLEGYCLGFLANALRVGNGMLEAEKTFARAWGLWQAGADTDSGLLPEWRLLDRWASLRRDQRRFAEALELLDRAFDTAPLVMKGRILVNKAVTLEHMGEPERAIEALRQATALVDGRREPRLRFALRFNLATNLCLLGKAELAQPMLEEIRELAVSLQKELDLVRVVWLQGRLSAGMGKRTDAVSCFEQVRREFRAREMDYDFALASLELAALYREENHRKKVKALAGDMLWIFRREGIHREALAALRLFCEAAERETVTVELTRRLFRFLHRARLNPELRFEA